MIVDLAASDREPLPAYDVAIVGSGPAGMTLAAELEGTGLTLCVLESGRARPTRRGDARRVVLSEGITIKDYSRERVLGGASTTWAGLSAPLDPIDFAERPWLGAPGWPLGREELVPFWEAAARRYRFAPLERFGPQGFGALKRQGDAQLAWRDVEEKIFLACAEPQDFGREWRGVFAGEGADLYLDATVLRLEGAGGKDADDGTAPRAEGEAGGEADGGEADDGGGATRPRVRRAALRSSDGRTFALRARVFVLATGGLENARLLLLSTDLCAAGLGNEHDQVGRFLMNHPKNYRGVIALARPVRELPYHFGCLHRGHAGYAGLRLREDLQRERRLLNSYVRFEPLFPWSDDRGVEAFVFLVKNSRGLLARWRRRHEDELVSLRDYSETGDDSDLQNERKGVAGWLGVVGLVLLHLPQVARYVFARLRHGRAPTVRAVRLRNFMEMEPHPDNRVLLGRERDPDGQPITLVRHAPTELDRRSLVALHAELADELAHNGFGRLDSDLGRAEPWPVDQDASHHMGTTRMGDDPATSVVDRDLRLHEVDNVYCAGASVFATSGCANPTFTIVALSVRLAGHLSARLGGGPIASEREAAAVVDPAGLPPASALGREGKGVLVLGAGGRVTTDVLPALVSLAGRFHVAGVFARGPRTLAAAGHAFDVRALDELSAADLAAASLVHVAVSKDAVPKVLERLSRHDVSHLDLLLDTPGLLFKHLGRLELLSGFRNVWVAEDCATLPWLTLLRRALDEGAVGEVRRVVFDRSAWRYHGLAMVKTVLGSSEVRRGRRRGRGKGATVELRMANGTTGVIVEPRDYAHGHWRVEGEAGVIADGPEGPEGALLLMAEVQDGLCVGYRLGERREALSPAESALLGPVDSGSSVVAAMDATKRIGLRRLLVAIDEGVGAWPLAEGLDDMAVDTLLEKLGRYRATPLTSVKSSLGRNLLGGALRLLRRG